MTSKPNFLLCFCPDLELINYHLQKICTQFALSNWQKKTFWADEKLEENFWSVFTSATLFGPGQIVWIRKAEHLDLSFWEEAKKYLLAKRSSTLAVFCFEKEWKGASYPFPKWFVKHPVYQLAKQKKWFFSSPGLNEKTKKELVLDKLKQDKKSIAPPTLNTLLKILPNQTYALFQELEKIILANSQEIRPESFSLLTVFSEENIFELFKNLLNKNYLNFWQKIMQEEGKSTSLLFPLLGLLSREAKVLWLLYNDQDSQISLPPYLKQEKKFLAKKLGLTKIANILDLALDCEYKVKSGQNSPEEALSYLFLNLSRLT